MPRVKIDTPGVTVEIDANEASVTELAAQALQLYRDAGGWPQHQPSAAGFVAERRWSPDHHDLAGNRGEFDEVKA
jgi:hypothetical protein